MEQLPVDVLALIAARDLFQGYALRMACWSLEKAIKPVANAKTKLRMRAVRYGYVNMYDWLSLMFKAKVSKRQLLKAASSAQLQMYEHLAKLYGAEEISILVQYAIRGGNADIVKHAIGKKRITPGCVAVAAFYGHLHLLKQFNVLGGKELKAQCINAISKAALGGSFKCVKYLTKERYPVTCAGSILLDNAITGGRIASIVYLKNYFGLEWSGTETLTAAGISNPLPIIKYLHEHGCPWHKHTVALLANRSQIEALEYAHANGAPFSTKIIETVIGEANVTTIKYLLKLGFECSPESLVLAAGGDYGQELVAYLHELGHKLNTLMMASALSHDNVAVVSYLVEHACPYPDKLFEIVFGNEALDCLQYIVKKGIMLPPDALMECIKYDPSSDMIIYLHDQLYDNVLPVLMPSSALPLTNAASALSKWAAKKLMKYACSHFSKNALLYLHSKGYQFNAKCIELLINNNAPGLKAILPLTDPSAHTHAFEYAATINRTCPEFLKILLKHKCPWSARVATIAIKYFKTFTWLLEHGCPWDDDTVMAVLAEDDGMLLGCLVRHGLVLDNDLISMMDKNCSKYVRANYPQYNVPEVKSSEEESEEE